MGFNKEEIPQFEWRFFKDLSKLTRSSPYRYCKYDTITAKNGRITTLGLQANKLHELPASIGNLTELIQLDLSRNGFIILPASIAKLTKLEGIRFDMENCVSIPSTFYHLRDNRSVNHNRILQIGFATGGNSSSTLRIVGEVFEYAEAIHKDLDYDGVFHPDNKKMVETSLSKFLVNLKFHKVTNDF